MKKLLLVLALTVAAGYLAAAGPGGKHASAGPSPTDFTYKCYRASTAPGTRFQRQSVVIDDSWAGQFDKRWTVLAPVSLCNFVEKFPAGAPQSQDGPPQTLVCYSIRTLGRNSFRRDDVFIENQFDTYTIDVSRATSICVVTYKIEVVGQAAGAETFAFKCYSARDTERTALQYTMFLGDQFEGKLSVLGRIQQLCSPSVKVGPSGEAASSPATLMTCYSLRQFPNTGAGEAAGTRDRLIVENQFGHQELRVRSVAQLCVSTNKGT